MIFPLSFMTVLITMRCRMIELQAHACPLRSLFFSYLASGFRNTRVFHVPKGGKSVRDAEL